MPPVWQHISAHYLNPKFFMDLDNLFGWLIFLRNGCGLGACNQRHTIVESWPTAQCVIWLCSWDRSMSSQRDCPEWDLNPRLWLLLARKPVCWTDYAIWVWSWGVTDSLVSHTMPLCAGVPVFRRHAESSGRLHSLRPALTTISNVTPLQGP